ncbi:chromatin accessibility complex protein 1 isoform X1 [Phyllostomus discolor]|uniref:Chromatin accessibility complex protein 1 n=1 Tax=Phyllostomus discolor TaxID=89673 RepID=A0A7E6E8Q8_9CHIR|nr:chromatin accessibility complex protein 1 isoform X1 [Phyllostomus discolor]
MADVAVGRDKCGEQRIVSLPLSRIRVIMKSSPEVSSINQEALMLTAKATELFVQHLATCSYRHGGGKEKKALTYNDLSNTAEESETFQFLAESTCCGTSRVAGAEQSSVRPWGRRPVSGRWVGCSQADQHVEAAEVRSDAETGLPHSAGGRPEDPESDFVSFRSLLQRLEQEPGQF